ncbi:MAG: DUF5320 domain-containing protein, partial [Deltaproteobacteria bacterium]|nr:DUF5320 domain-containing protein [Deltaproteobacteria bacterium]
MPGFNRRGPEGEGPRTGRNMGKCRPLENDATDEAAVEQNETDEFFGQGRGGLAWGCGRGFGGGMRPGR